MKNPLIFLILSLLLLTNAALASAEAETDSDTANIKTILSSEEVIRKLKPTQTFQSVYKKGESYVIRLRNTDGSCEQYLAVVLAGISTSQEYVQHVVVSDKSESCK